MLGISLGIALFGVFMILAGLNAAPSLYREPTSITERDLAAPSRDLHRDYVSVEGVVLDSGFREVKVRKNYLTGSEKQEGGEQARYSVMLTGDRFLLVKHHSELKGRAVAGTLVRMPPDVEREVVMVLGKDHREVQEGFLPWMLEAADDPVGGTVVALFSVVAMGGLLGAALALSRLRWPGTHPVARRLSRYGDWSEVAATIDREAAEGLEAWCGNRIQLTRTWVLTNRETRPVDELVWCSVLPPLSGSVQTTATLRFRDQGQVTEAGGVSELLGLQVRLAQRAPWILGGSEADARFLRSWPELLAEVDGRRASG